MDFPIWYQLDRFKSLYEQNITVKQNMVPPAVGAHILQSPEYFEHNTSQSS